MTNSISNAIEIVQGEAECYLLLYENFEYHIYPCYHLLIVYQLSYLLSSISRQPLLKLSSKNNSVTIANCRTHVHLLTVLFHFANCTISLKQCYFTFP